MIVGPPTHPGESLDFRNVVLYQRRIVLRMESIELGDVVHLDLVLYPTTESPPACRAVSVIFSALKIGNVPECSELTRVRSLVTYLSFSSKGNS